ARAPMHAQVPFGQLSTSEDQSEQAYSLWLQQICDSYQAAPPNTSSSNGNEGKFVAVREPRQHETAYKSKQNLWHRVQLTQLRPVLAFLVSHAKSHAP